MSIAKGKTIHIKHELPNNECNWFTIHKGEVVPENLLKEYLVRGGLVEEVEPVEKVEAVEEVEPVEEISKEKYIEDMDKDELESYTKEKHGLDLDRRKSLKSLLKQVKDLI